MDNEVSDLQDLKSRVIEMILNDELDDESNIILKELLEINQLGLITTESQPHLTKKFGNYNWIQRAFLNGFFPHQLMDIFINKLIDINPNILVAETILNPKGKKYDKLVLWNFQDYDYDIIVDNNYYPLHMQLFNNGKIVYHSGFTGNVVRPALRDDYMENYSDLLLEQLYDNNYSLIEIYSRDINDELFKDIIKALKYLNNL